MAIVICFCAVSVKLVCPGEIGYAFAFCDAGGGKAFMTLRCVFLGNSGSLIGVEEKG